VSIVVDDPVASALASFADDHPNGWRGSMTALLELLGAHAGETIRRAREWPATPQALANAIDRCVPLLREKGVMIERHRSHAGRTVLVSRKAAEI
jgi:hypothetical protein